MGFPAWTRTLAQISSNLVSRVIIKNPNADGMPFVVRNSADTIDVFYISNSGSMRGNIVEASASGDSFAAISGTGGIRFGNTSGQTWIRRFGAQAINSDSVFGTKAMTTAARPAANAVLAGMFYYDTTVGKPVWSDGTNWRDAAGTIV